MKKILISAVICILSTQIGTAQSECSKYYPLEDGASFQYTSYNGKGKLQGKTDYTVTNVSDSEGKTSATMQMKYQDHKGKEVMSSEYGFTCEGDVVKIDFQSLMNQQMMQQFAAVEIDVTGTDIELPNNLTVGQELADANVNIAADMGGMTMNMNVETINRKVEKKEMVSSPVGEFDCYVIYSENKTKMAMMGNKTFPSRIWLAEGIGMVKQESYNQKGKLTNSMVLTKLEK
ncbi:hypothetical protein DKG77_06615 [Flagellimonas aquimarina]|jgi:hypothetical protein|uniref:DUF3108 domain-containing protein n=1 Tax=Flagellimonas aquimarina TaxID=2201895 RepID=A0A316L1S5_9FLAO|nr:hypothetical protein [Allomuricauda koreensis]PWL40477.1 hypothetical protein DKG77_06615 [Allomuricauda koreensis]